MQNSVFLNRYRLSLGRNGLPVELHRTPAGITYRAQEIGSGREVAIELVPWAASEAPALAQLQEKADAAKKLNHVNIPVLYDFGLENDQLVYVTEIFDGHTAAAWVAARGPLPIGAALRVAIQVAGALGAASFYHLRHPAVNPANIVFVPGQTAEGDWPAIKLLHWLAPPSPFAAQGGNEAGVEAAARFASPEQRRGGVVDFASEVYSLGSTLWFLLSGLPPASGAVAPEVKFARAGAEKLRGCPKILRHLLGRMLRANPAERPQDPVALLAYLQTCLARVERREGMRRRLGVPVAAGPRVVPAATARRWSMKPLALAALLVACAALAAIAVPRYLHSRSAMRTNMSANEARSIAPRAEIPREVDLVASTPAAQVPPRSDRPATNVVATNSRAAEIPRDEMSSKPAAPATAPNDVVEPTSVAEAPPAADQATIAASDSNDSEMGRDQVPAESAAPVTAPNDAAEPTGVAQAPSSADRGTATIVASNSNDAKIPREQAPGELAEPAEGPGEATAASSPETAPDKTPVSVAQSEAPAEPEPTPLKAPAAMPPNEKSSAPVSAENVANLAADSSAPAPVAVEPKTDSVAIAKSSNQKKSPARLAATRSRLHKKSNPESATTSARRSRKKVRVARVQSRRGRKVPPLRVGSDHAELVGTTSDGRWILSVAASGRRIIVPPPPGFER